MKKLLLQFLFIATLCICTSLNAQRSADPTVPPATSQLPANNVYKNSNITYELISSADNTWGYNILVDGKLTITQPFIPAVSGNHAFQTRKDADIVANLMIDKMKSGIMPPAITIEELKQHHIIK